MKVAIMQPYFFPYVGYYSLIKHTDKFVLFDPVQFIRHGWIERNRILKPGEGWQYIQVPLVKHSRETLIKDILVRNSENWKEKLLAQLQHYKKRAPFFQECMALTEKCLSLETDSIVHLNAYILKHTCNYLDIKFDCQIFSEMSLSLGDINAPDEWALRIAQAMGAKEYINPPGGQSFFDPPKYSENGIKLTFLSNKITPYSQRRPVFEGGLSIIDLLMFNDVPAINEMIDNIEFIS